VLSGAVHGGTAILRGLAGLPLVTPLLGEQARILLVSAEDVAATVAFALTSAAPRKAVWDVANPEPVALGTIVTSLRQWLGFRPRPVLSVPAWLARSVSAIADLLGWLGWRSPARTTAMKQLAAGMHGDPAPWIAATGIRPKTLAEILAAQPATVQDRWHARLYFVKPLAIGVLAVFWIATGLIALGPGWNDGVALLQSPMMSKNVTALVIIAGALLDISLGAALLVRSLTRAVLITMLLVCVIYLVAATAIDPSLWLDPLGRITKTFAVMLATVFTLAVLDER